MKAADRRRYVGIVENATTAIELLDLAKFVLGRASNSLKAIGLDEELDQAIEDCDILSGTALVILDDNLDELGIPHSNPSPNNKEV